MSWIQSHGGLRDHPKKDALAEALFDGDGVPSDLASYAAVGLLQHLWWWATEYAGDGDLSHLSDNQIARGCRWQGDATKLVKALTECGFLDPDRSIHDWYEYAGRLLEKRDKDRARKARARYEGKQKDVQRTSDGQDADAPRDGARKELYKELKKKDLKPFVVQETAERPVRKVKQVKRLPFPAGYDRRFVAFVDAYGDHHELPEAERLYLWWLEQGAAEDDLLAAAQHYARDCLLNDRPMKMPSTFLAKTRRPWVGYVDFVPLARNRRNGRSGTTTARLLQIADALDSGGGPMAQLAIEGAAR